MKTTLTIRGHAFLTLCGWKSEEVQSYSEALKDFENHIIRKMKDVYFTEIGEINKTRERISPLVEEELLRKLDEKKDGWVVIIEDDVHIFENQAAAEKWMREELLNIWDSMEKSHSQQEEQEPHIILHAQIVKGKNQYRLDNIVDKGECHYDEVRNWLKNVVGLRQKQIDKAVDAILEYNTRFDLETPPMDHELTVALN